MADSLALPIDPAARYGAGADRVIALGGGGLYFVAWQVGYLSALSRGGVDLALGERVVGTSAGSVVATALTGGRLGRLHGQISALSRVPALLRLLAPTGTLRPSQDRALAAFRDAVDAEPATVREIGRAALAAITPDAARLRASLRVVLQVSTWPSPALHITCVDAYTGERCVVSTASGIPPVRAVAASSAVPGLFPPQPLGDRRCMDGGVSGSGLHLDLLAGARRALVLTLGDASPAAPAGMTEGVGAVAGEIAALRASGTVVFDRHPGEVDRATLMDPDAVPEALAAGDAAAQADHDAVSAFWA